MPSMEIHGEEQFNALAKRLRQAEGELQPELYQALERAAPPLERAATRSAEANLPHRGGLNAVVAAAGMSHQRRAGGIRITARGITQLALTNRGEVRHPVYGDPGTWVQQLIPKAKDWFDKPIRDGAPAIRKELEKALEKIARKIA
jgi:TPR repeat protein